MPSVRLELIDPPGPSREVDAADERALVSGVRIFVQRLVDSGRLPTEEQVSVKATGGGYHRRYVVPIQRAPQAGRPELVGGLDEEAAARERELDF